MDLTEEKVSFDQVPTVVSELKQEISGLKTLIRTLIGAAPKDAWMNIDELRAYHPDQPGNADVRLKVIIKKAGINKNVTFHVARHTFATLTLTYGADLYTVSKLLV